VKYRISPSRQFLKTVRRYARSGRNKVVDAIPEVADLLATHDNRALFVLHRHWRDHALKGNQRGIRELHLDADDLLLYCIHEEAREIEFIDIVSHEELRKQ
jgi:mRNA interferase YafQ